MYAIRSYYECIAQLLHLAQTAHALQLALGVDDGHTGRVIAAVFEAAQAFDQDFRHVTLCHCTYNSTHSYNFV